MALASLQWVGMREKRRKRLIQMPYHGVDWKCQETKRQVGTMTVTPFLSRGKAITAEEVSQGVKGMLILTITTRRCFLCG